jgi:hypothetical protein
MVATMVRFACCSVLIALAGCPPRQPQAVAQPQLEGAGCPSASGVYLASYATQEQGKRSGWVMPLYAPPAGQGPGSDVADYTVIDDATAKAAGVPDLPSGKLWLVLNGTQPPCALAPGHHYVANIDGHEAYGLEIDGCAAPPDPQDATGLVLISDEPPSGCTFQAPQPIAGRVGEMTGPKQWQRPQKETPIPPELASLVPQHACTAPGCETLWTVGEVRVQDKPVAWAVAVNWLTVGDPAAPCDWKAERWSGFFVPGEGGAPVKVTESLTHPLALSSVLVDRAGARVLLAEGPGEYATYDLSPAGPKLGMHVTWMAASDEDWASIDNLGPICAPDATPQPATP